MKTKLNIDSGGSWDTTLTPTLDADCGGASQYWGEGLFGSGVHAYAVRTDGGTCTLSFASEGFLTSSITGHTLTSTQQDFTATPLTLLHSLKATVSDDLGNPVTNATLFYAGAGATVQNGNDYYFSAANGANIPLTISRSGYVTENGSGQNSALSTVSNGVGSMQTTVTLAGSTACTGNVAAGAHVTCAGLQRDFTLTVQANNVNLNTATVAVYTDAAHTQLADDLSKTGTADATGAASNGTYRAALSSGTYYYTVSAPGYTDIAGSSAVVDGTSNTLTVSMAGQVAADTTVSASQSTISLSPSSANADGISLITATAVAKNASGVLLPGKAVTVSYLLNGQWLTFSTKASDANGVAAFPITSNSVGTVQVTAVIDGVLINGSPTAQFVSAGLCPFGVGLLVKLPDDGNPATQQDSAVYFYGNGCKRHAFSNSKVYFSWYADFSGVQIVSSQTLAAMPLGKNVTYRPGTKMIKFSSLNAVYAVANGGVLRWLKTEPAAATLYGLDWNKKIDDVSDAFYTDYAFGADINAASDFNIVNEQNSTPTISDNF